MHPKHHIKWEVDFKMYPSYDSSWCGVQVCFMSLRLILKVKVVEVSLITNYAMARPGHQFDWTEPNISRNTNVASQSGSIECLFDTEPNSRCCHRIVQDVPGWLASYGINRDKPLNGPKAHTTFKIRWLVSWSAGPGGGGFHLKTACMGITACSQTSSAARLGS